MTRSRIAGAVLLVLLGAGLTRITDRAGEPPKNLPVRQLKSAPSKPSLPPIAWT